MSRSNSNTARKANEANTDNTKVEGPTLAEGAAMVSQAGEQTNEQSTNGATTTTTTTSDEPTAELLAELMAKIEPVKNNKSAVFRILSAAGWKTGSISKWASKFYGKEVKYQQVRNCLLQPPPKAA